MFIALPDISSEKVNILYKFLNFFLSLLVFASCKSKTDKVFFIPPDAIPFEYYYYGEEEQKFVQLERKFILLDGTLNDNIPLKVMFDTGDGAREVRLTVSDSLKQMLSEEDNFLQIGPTKNHVNLSFFNKNNWFFQYFGANAASIGCGFFKNKIVEISYRNKYIRELDSMPQLDLYERVKIGESMKVPVRVLIQGHWITRNVLMDTGSNGLLDLSSDIVDDYFINMDNAQSAISFSAVGERSKQFVPFDSISVCGYTISATKPLGILSGKWRGGLLGNIFFENFDMVLDLKDYYLYLKPIEKK